MGPGEDGRKKTNRNEQDASLPLANAMQNQIYEIMIMFSDYYYSITIRL